MIMLKYISIYIGIERLIPLIINNQNEQIYLINLIKTCGRLYLCKQIASGQCFVNIFYPPDICPA